MKVMKDVSYSKFVAIYRWGRASTKVEKCPPHNAGDYGL